MTVRVIGTPPLAVRIERVFAGFTCRSDIRPDAPPLNAERDACLVFLNVGVKFVLDMN